MSSNKKVVLNLSKKEFEFFIGSANSAQFIVNGLLGFLHSKDPDFASCVFNHFNSAFRIIDSCIADSVPDGLEGIKVSQDEKK